MSKIEIFEEEQEAIRKLGFQNVPTDSEPMFRQYQKRNTFGFDTNQQIHRIFQEEFLDKDIADGFLTLPNASASIWNHPLENPLADVEDIDLVTGSNIHLGTLVSSLYALCWTDRSKPRREDWDSFSHGKKVVRITTTVGKLMDRMMSVGDPYYMHRAWNRSRLP